MWQPKVSIILPTYNWNKKRFQESVDSVLKQTFKDYELIIINDCSTNDIEETIKEYEKKETRIVYIKNEKNLKLTKTLNKGISIAKWKYIARIDDDDIWSDNDKLEKQMIFMEDNPEYWLCWVEKMIKIDECWKTIESTLKKCSDIEIRNSILKRNQFIHSSVIIRKSILKNLWLYNPRFNKAEDYELWCRIWLKNKFKNIKNSAIKYRINTNWICKKNELYQKLLSLKICIKYAKNYPNFSNAFFYRILDLTPERFLKYLIKLKKIIIIYYNKISTLN